MRQITTFYNSLRLPSKLERIAFLVQGADLESPKMADTFEVSGITDKVRWIALQTMD